MNRANGDAITLLFPMINSEIVKYYPTEHHITCEVRIRVSKHFVESNPVLISPMFINTIKGRSWLTTVYDVEYQPNMIFIMHQKFTAKLATLQLVVENFKIMHSKLRIDILRATIESHK